MVLMGISFTTLFHLFIFNILCYFTSMLKPLNKVFFLILDYKTD